MQSTCFDAIWHGTGNIAVAAPTGSGKTALFELAIIALLCRNNSNIGKIVYLAPMRALAMERTADWRSKFKNLRVAAILGGDDASTQTRTSVENADIIITTPEKLDAMSRKWRDHRELLGQIGLLCVDEVHLLGEPRGATLEAVITRCKMVSVMSDVISKGWPAANLRIVALSATLPNLVDIAGMFKIYS